jgi:hypothetical protein
MSSWPLLTYYVRLLYLRALNAVAQGAACQDPRVGVLLADARMCAFPGRDGAPRSLGSVYGCFVTLFLGGSIRGVLKPLGSSGLGPDPYADGLTESCRGAHLITYAAVPFYRAFALGDGATADLVLPEDFTSYWLASDGTIFIPVRSQSLVLLLSVSLEYLGHVYTGESSLLSAVCATETAFVVADYTGSLRVHRRTDGECVRVIGTAGAGPGELGGPVAVCFTADGRHVAVAELRNHRVSVFCTDSAFIRHVGVGRLVYPNSIACSASDELFVASNCQVFIFHLNSDVVLRTVDAGGCSRLALHGTRVFLHQGWNEEGGNVVWQSYRELI